MLSRFIAVTTPSLRWVIKWRSRVNCFIRSSLLHLTVSLFADFCFNLIYNLIDCCTSTCLYLKRQNCINFAIWIFFLFFFCSIVKQIANNRDDKKKVEQALAAAGLLKEKVSAIVIFLIIVYHHHLLLHCKYFFMWLTLLNDHCHCHGYCCYLWYVTCVLLAAFFLYHDHIVIIITSTTGQSISSLSLSPLSSSMSLALFDCHPHLIIYTLIKPYTHWSVQSFHLSVCLYLSFSLMLSIPLLICGVIYYVYVRFFTPSIYHFLRASLAYFSNHSLF